MSSVLFGAYWGAYPGDSLSNSSKKYDQARTYVILGKGVCAIKHSSLEKVFASLGEQMSMLTVYWETYIQTCGCMCMNIYTFLRSVHWEGLDARSLSSAQFWISKYHCPPGATELFGETTEAGTVQGVWNTLLFQKVRKSQKGKGICWKLHRNQL